MLKESTVPKLDLPLQSCTFHQSHSANKERKHQILSLKAQICLNMFYNYLIIFEQLRSLLFVGRSKKISFNIESHRL